MTLRNISASLALALAVLSSNAMAQISISVNVGPPPLPVDEQPPVPGDGYIWTPGYWAWDDDAQAYYWVTGTWVLAPFNGGLWTPGYWFSSGNDYRWRPGYWSRRVGFYGNINYGHGYDGQGYDGGRWRNGAFSYNPRVTAIDGHAVRHIHDARVPQARRPGGISVHRGEAGGVAHPVDPGRPSPDRGQSERTPIRVEQERFRAPPHARPDARPPPVEPPREHRGLNQPRSGFGQPTQAQTPTLQQAPQPSPHFMHEPRSERPAPRQAQPDAGAPAQRQAAPPETGLNLPRGGDGRQGHRP